MKITKYPQSCFLIESLGKRFIVDPGNLVLEKMSNFNINDWKNIDAVFITHKHKDHIDSDLLKEVIELNSGIKIYTNYETVETLDRDEIKSVEVKVGDILNFNEFKIEIVGAQHGYHVWFTEGNYPKIVTGFVFDDGEHRLYHPGDTIMFPDYPKADVFLAPVCGNAVVMEPAVAIEFAKHVGAGLIIPMHYESPRHPMGYERFEEIAKNLAVNYKILQNGESLEL